MLYFESQSTPLTKLCSAKNDITDESGSTDNSATRGQRADESSEDHLQSSYDYSREPPVRYPAVLLVNAGRRIEDFLAKLVKRFSGPSP
jgi:hypothetical protein